MAENWTYQSAYAAVEPGWQLDGPELTLDNNFVHESDARKAATAPELLEACELMLETALATHTAEHYVFVAAVIAKAKGEAQNDD